ncbi:protein of unknown function [Alcaligenes faecalis subsp. faecalis]|nr:protein of unknown function [Alcaligenes faecalis subsp. faecalis]
MNTLLNDLKMTVYESLLTWFLDNSVAVYRPS